MGNFVCNFKSPVLLCFNKQPFLITDKDKSFRKKKLKAAEETDEEEVEEEDEDEDDEEYILVRE